MGCKFDQALSSLLKHHMQAIESRYHLHAHASRSIYVKYKICMKHNGCE